jgi:hypothetical protein
MKNFCLAGISLVSLEDCFDCLNIKIQKEKQNNDQEEAEAHQQDPQRNGLSHFVIFAESGKNKTYYISLDGFGHAFDIMTGEGHAKYQIPD